MASNKEAWLTDLRALLALSQAPSCLLECDGNFQAAAQGDRRPQPRSGARGPALRERFVGANAAWCRLLEYEEHEVVGRSFSEIRGLQGQLTDDSSKLKLGSLLITKETRVEGLRVVNYTARSRRPLELQVCVNIIKHRGLNVFFMCSLVGHREVAASAAAAVVPEGRPAAAPIRVAAVTSHSLEEPEPEEMPADESQQRGPDSWQVSAARRLAVERRPCVLVTFERLDGDGTRPAVLRERVSCANDAWYRLYEYTESEIAQRSFSEIPGFHGPLTSDVSILKMASIALSKESVAEEVKMVNYTRRGRKPIEATLHINIFKQSGFNVAFLCTVASAVEVLVPGRGTDIARQPCEEEPAAEDFPPAAGGPMSRQSSEEVYSPVDVWSRQTTAASQHGEEDNSGGCVEGLRHRRMVTAWA